MTVRAIGPKRSGVPVVRMLDLLLGRTRELWASDFFCVHTVTFRTVYVFVVIDHHRRRIEHGNITAHPTAAWVWHQVIEATGWQRPPRFWIRDRDVCYRSDFDARAGAIGITPLRTPVRAPQANAIAERVIGTLRRECPHHVLVWNERYLRRVCAVLQRV